MKFKAVEKINPRKPEEPRKWYAQIVTDGETTIDEIVKETEKFSALSEPDIHGVIIGLENVVQDKLAAGKICGSSVSVLSIRHCQADPPIRRKKLLPKISSR